MKAVFPCKGVVVLTKKDIQNLESYYNTVLATSKMAEIYSTTEYMLQIGNLNYLPKKSKIFINEDNLLTISQLRSIMNDRTTEKQNNQNSQNSQNLEQKEELISDDDILSHPFFTTLKPID